MKERPIIFNTEMVRAILEGEKTQTRRVIKPQPRSYDDYMNSGEQALGFNTGRKSTMVIPDIEEAKRVMPAWCPYGQVGDRLWVRETFYINENDPLNAFRAYKASPETYMPFRLSLKSLWRPSIHMYRWASRITLEITGVRVERLQEITLEDCKAEGIKGYTFARGCLSNNPPDARWAFIRLWDSLNAKRGYPWEMNPWVWTIEFSNIEEDAER